MNISPTRAIHPKEQAEFPDDAAKTMFEIYRDAKPPRQVHVVYYTELPEQLHQHEIERAFAGDSIFAGFLRDRDKRDAKHMIRALIERLNNDEDLSANAIASDLHSYLV